MSAIATLPRSAESLRAAHAELHDGREQLAKSERGGRPSAEMSDLPRSASYTYISPLAKSIIDNPPAAGMPGEDFDDDGASKNTSTESFTSCESGQDTAPTPPSETVSEDTVTLEKSQSSVPDAEELSQAISNGPGAPKSDMRPQAIARPTTALRDRSESPRRSLSMLRRRSWKLTSLSPSRRDSDASSEGATSLPEVAAGTAPSNTRRRLPFSRSTAEAKPDTADDTPRPLTLSRRGSLFTKKSKKSKDLTVEVNTKRLSKSAVARIADPVPRSFSTDRLPSFSLSNGAREGVPPLPENANSNKHAPIRIDVHRKRDELWNAFRTLDGDYQKFQSKPTALKGNVLRQALLPFLKTHHGQASVKSLRVEDLDRRCNIFNKWWMALLELLRGRNNQSISGTDRPAMLDALIGIMERPEWRLHPSPFCPLADRLPSSGTSRSTSSVSVASSSTSDFLQESVYHNVRNIFIQNVTAQMGLAVEKMSLRSAPASLVTFCGKTCAYAFMFCPGIADMLIRLWSPDISNLRRIFQLRTVRSTKFKDESRDVASSFPPNLHSLLFETAVQTSRELKKQVSPPIGTTDVQWHGPWKKRWCGTDSDLFYVFAKHYYILVADFFPSDVSNLDHRLIPGLILVEAQLLENLNATMHRNSAPQLSDEPSSGASSVTFDDVLGEPDAHAAMPMSPANPVRLMAENRLIMLIRDFLSERNSLSPSARQLFARSFSDMFKACAQRISVFDQSACYILCDFAEEALVILMRYENSLPAAQPVLDWTFWVAAWKGMTASQNTTTEIRLYSLVFSLWVHIADQRQRKEELCLSFLLDSELFESRFNHWCPMVRAYYMRLLAWRVARLNEDSPEDDTEIHRALFARLKSTWSHYQYLRGDADAKGEPTLSTAPCSPAPGRRILIIRTDSVISSTGNPFVSFDGIVAPTDTAEAEGLQKSSGLLKLSETNLQPLFGRVNSDESLDSESTEDGAGKKKWGFLRNLVNVTKPRTSVPEETPTSTPRSSSNSPSSSGTSTPKNFIKDAPATHRAFSFKFSLEWTDRRYPFPAPARIPPPRLPAPAQNALISHLLEDGDTAVPPPVKPTGPAVSTSRYSGRALAEWMIVVNEYQSFFDRRLKEGVPTSRLVETPTLSFEAFKNPR